MKMKNEKKQWHNAVRLGLVGGAVLFASAASAASAKHDEVSGNTMTFVRGGLVQDVRMIGAIWTQGDGYLESDPAPPSQNPQALFAARSIGSGDFHIKARLTILKVKRSAAAFCFGHDDYFGFEGGHGSMYVTGPLFNNALGKKIGTPEDHFREGEPFDFECIRKEDILHVLIGDKTVYTQKVSVRALGPCGFTPGRSTMRVHEFSATGDLQPYKKPEKPGRKYAINHVNNITVHPFVKPPFPELREANHVRMGNGCILAAIGTESLVSGDEGKTWQAHPLFAAGTNLKLMNSALICTREGVVILFFSNAREQHYSWDLKRNRPNPDCRLPTYMIRSLDNGKTWTEPRVIDDGYCGYLNGCIQTRNGTVIVAGQELLYEEGRHITRPYVSQDNGATWVKADKIDIDMPAGDHSGLIEATLEQLADGRIWMLLRSYRGFFYESFSSDDGLS